MKNKLILLASFMVILLCHFSASAQLPKELPLWPKGIPGNPVVYKQEKERSSNVSKSSLSQLNRVFSCVSNPTYIIHKPKKGKANGVALVICPGGGFRDVWFDREGNEFGLWLAQQGITSLVLKYRTFNSDAEGFTLSRKDYLPQVYADAKQAIFTLRSMAKDLGIDEHKIGISGFSAGGTLALRVALEIDEKDLPPYAKFNQVNANPDFAGLFYPGLGEDLTGFVKQKETFPPVFMMNGGEDKTTPPENCIELYKVLKSKSFSAELHIYSKGGHGFDSGLDRGFAVSTWQNSFLAWLKDQGFMKEN
jgi:acetyl esterase/lipase